MKSGNYFYSMIAMKLSKKLLKMKFLSITHTQAIELIQAGKLHLIGGNMINNQGEYSVSEDGTKLYKRRFSSPKAVFDIIAAVVISNKKASKAN